MSSELPLIDPSSSRRPVSSRREAVDELAALRARLKRLRRQEEHARITNANATKRSASIEKVRKEIKTSVVVPLPPASSPRQQQQAAESHATSSTSGQAKSGREALQEHRREKVLDMRREHLLNQCKIGITRNELLAASQEIKRHVIEGEHHARKAQFLCQAEKASVVTAMRRSYHNKLDRESAECQAEIAKLQKEERELRARLDKARHAMSSKEDVGEERRREEITETKEQDT
jgi:hypothetical protein